MSQNRSRNIQGTSRKHQRCSGVILDVSGCFSEIIKMVRSTLLQVPRGRQNASGGVPPLGIPRTPLTHDISGSSSSNERFSTWIPIIFNVDYDGINPVPVRQREHQEYFGFLSKSCQNHEIDDPRIDQGTLREHPGTTTDALECSWMYLGHFQKS